MAAVIVFGLLLIGIRKICTEPIYDVHRHQILQNMYNYGTEIPQYVISKNRILGSRLKNGISSLQKAELSWLAINTEPDDRKPVMVAPRAQRIHLTTEQPSTKIIYRRYSRKPIIRRTQSPNYFTNFHTLQPIYYNGYVTQRFSPDNYASVSTMMSAINKILSIVQKTMQPDGTNSGFPDGLWNISNGQSLSPSAVLRNGNKDAEATGTEQERKTPIGKVEEVEKWTNSFGMTTIDSDKNSEGNIASASSQITIAPSTNDGSNLLESLLHGRLDKVDWFGSLLGTNKLPTKEEGNALAQIFQGGIFGPAN